LNIKENISRLISWFSTVVIINIRDEDNYELKQTLRLSHIRGVLYSVFIVLGIFILSFMLIKTVLSKWFDPVQIRLESNRKMIILSTKIDSLEQEINGRNIYLATIKKVINGDKLSTDKLKDEAKDSIKEISTESLDQLSAPELEIRKEFEAEQKQANTKLSSNKYSSPLIGNIQSKFNLSKQHFGLDIIGVNGALIKSIAAGKVVFAELTKNSGFVMVVQHSNSLVSVYKHNSSILKKVGNFVKSGEEIAVIGKYGESIRLPNLHLELWYDGKPIDPQRFISFE
jgi:murein DD-endopeptidase MepM/ murein hydrolase activator NlpD